MIRKINMLRKNKVRINKLEIHHLSHNILRKNRLKKSHKDQTIMVLIKITKKVHRHNWNLKIHQKIQKIIQFKLNYRQKYKQKFRQRLKQSHKQNLNPKLPKMYKKRNQLKVKSQNINKNRKMSNKIQITKVHKKK